jgi:CheY-like chemotaxis protein
VSGCVWVVDDDDGYRDLLGALLETHCGFGRVRSFGRGEDAMRELCAVAPGERPDALLLDFHMPGMNGLALLRALRSAGAQLPVAVLSGAASPLERAACAREGASTFIRKPACAEDLIDALNLWRNALPEVGYDRTAPQCRPT